MGFLFWNCFILKCFILKWHNLSILFSYIKLKCPFCPKCFVLFLISLQFIDHLKQIPMPSFENPPVYRYIATKVFFGLKKKEIFLLNPILSRCISPPVFFFLSQLLWRSPSPLPLFLTSCELRRSELLCVMNVNVAPPFPCSPKLKQTPPPP